MFSNITGETTLASWTQRRGQLGVTGILIHYNGSKDHPVIVYVNALTGGSRGAGATEAEAIDDAFARLLAIIGASFCESERTP